MEHPDIQHVLVRQRGLITREQACASISEHAINRRIANGTWLVVHTNVYRHAAVATTYEQQLLAAVLACGPGTAVSHRSAVALHGLRGFDSRVVEVTRPTRIDQPLPGVRVHRLDDLGPAWLTDRDGLPITRTARTLVDLGAATSPGVVRWCMEEWLADRKVTIRELRDAIVALSRRGRTGVGILRRLLDERVLVDLVADSASEVLLLEILAGAGLPKPEFHHLVTVDGVVIAELDVAYPEVRIAIEVDGYGVHLRSRRVFEYDRQRQNELEILGWAVLRFTRQALLEHPTRVAGQVERLLRARSVLL